MLPVLVWVLPGPVDLNRVLHKPSNHLDVLVTDRSVTTKKGTVQCPIVVGFIGVSFIENLRLPRDIQLEYVSN